MPVAIAFFVFLLIAPPVFLIMQLRSGEIWGHGFGFPHAKRSTNPGMFWTVMAFEIIAMLAMWAADVILVWRGQ